MIDKDLFRKTEGRLYKYCKDIKLIEKLKKRVVLLWKQKEEILKEKSDLKHLDIDTYLNMGIDYSRDKVQSSSTGSGEGEKGTIKYIDNLQRQYVNTVKRILKTNARVRELELQIQDMHSNLAMISEESKRFIECKYGECKSVEWIAEEMYLGARSTAYRKREELIQDIGQWVNIIK
jgi:hypothetical protein